LAAGLLARGQQPGEGGDRTQSVGERQQDDNDRQRPYDNAPDNEKLLPPDLDRFADRLEVAFERMPALARAGIKNVINGPFTFGPDGNPLIGPALATAAARSPAA